MVVNLKQTKEFILKNKEPSFNREREFSVILEGLRSDFRVYGEGLSDLREKVVKLSDKVDGIFEMTGKNTEDISFIKTDIRAIRNDLKIFNKRITLLEKTVLNNN
jgi:hypothetical protein